MRVMGMHSEMLVEIKDEGDSFTCPHGRRAGAVGRSQHIEVAIIHSPFLRLSRALSLARSFFLSPRLFLSLPLFSFVILGYICFSVRLVLIFSSFPSACLSLSLSSLHRSMPCL